MVVDQLLRDQPGFDGLSEPDIICDQEANARHACGAHHRRELVLLDLDTTTERSLKNIALGQRRRAPPQCA